MGVSLRPPQTDPRIHTHLTMCHSAIALNVAPFDIMLNMAAEAPSSLTQHSLFE
jgi:hypothetical protein